MNKKKEEDVAGVRYMCSFPKDGYQPKQSSGIDPEKLTPPSSGTGVVPNELGNVVILYMASIPGDIDPGFSTSTITYSSTPLTEADIRKVIEEILTEDKGILKLFKKIVKKIIKKKSFKK